MEFCNTKELVYATCLAGRPSQTSDIEAFPSLTENFETKGEILSNHGNSESELASSPLPVGTPLDHIFLGEREGSWSTG